MARRAREVDRVPMPTAPRNHSTRMLAVGKAHELHAVGKLLGETGARASMCGLYGSFYDPPPRSRFPVVPGVLRRGAPVNDLELRAALIDAVRAPGPCEECVFECGAYPDVAANPFAERIARAIEDGDIEIRVKEGAWL